jgi:HD-GYP domain-containing protein (c-di-GMP phosphodiesterase class II)
VTPAVTRYITLLSALFWGGVAVVLGAGLDLPGHSLVFVAPLVGFAIAAEALVVSRENSSASFSVAAHIAAAILFGPFVAAVVAAVGVLLVDGIRLGPRPAVFLNSAIFGLSAAAGGFAFLLAGGSVGPLTERDLVAAIALIGVRFVANEVLLGIAISLDSGTGLLRLIRDNLRELVGAAVGEGCLGVLVAFGYTGRHWIILPFLLPLLVGLYQAQLNFERLKRETAAALNAFAGVIDERDPNTASHSKRVAEYVQRFVTAIELPDREAARLVAAARYHDLGKVVVDESTLSRPGRLSEEELRKIRSHPAVSARLLSPFHFAREMALYAELHHERYDGRGYYSVPQREIPIEAHVLIVADSFDAMTSPRAYRAALSTTEAVEELRDKAGSQFHPLVAEAFAATIEGREMPAGLGPEQLAALRAEFSRVATIQLPRPRSLAQPRMLTVCFATATAVSGGLPVAPVWLDIALAGLTTVAAVAAVAAGLRERRRRRLTHAALAEGSHVTAALAGGGINGWVGWLHWNELSERYDLAVEGEAAAAQRDIEDLRLRAVRGGSAGRSGMLESGLHYAITPVSGPLPRLAVWTHERLSEFEVALVDDIATAAAATAAQRAGPTALDGRDRRISTRVHVQRSLAVDLRAFEDVRAVAGQLSAERVVADAAARLAGAIRRGDECRQVGDDRFVISVGVSDRSEIDAVSERIRSALRDVPVPRRADPIQPFVRLIDAVDDDLRAAG